MRTSKSKMRPSGAKKTRRKASPKRSVNKGGTKHKKRLPPDPNSPLEKALTLMKGGVSQSDAARAEGVSRQRLARYRKRNTSSKKKGGKWLIRDHRPAQLYIASGGKLYAIPVPYRTKGEVGRYWNTVNRFLLTNDAAELKSISGSSIRDIYGKKHVLETDPNTLRMMDAIGDLDFLQIYANSAN